MACIDTKAPINLSGINNNALPKCGVTCKYNFNYGISSCKVKPYGNFLKYYYDGKSDVTFNLTGLDSKYSVKEIRIYSPCLTYYSLVEKPQAEIFIHHINKETGKNLLVCIPISISDSTSKSSDLLGQMIISGINNNGTLQSINVSNFTLNSLIPISEYYNYSGNIPYSPNGDDECKNVKADIIVFPAHGNINMKNHTYKTLTTLISGAPTNIIGLQNPSSVSLQYNKDGTNINNTNGNDDDIYIKCNPIGDDGKEIVMDDDSMLRGRMEGPDVDAEEAENFKKELIRFLIYFALFIVMLASIFVGYKVINKWLKAIAEQKTNTA